MILRSIPIMQLLNYGIKILTAHTEVQRCTKIGGGVQITPCPTSSLVHPSKVQVSSSKAHLHTHEGAWRLKEGGGTQIIQSEKQSLPGCSRTAPGDP